MGENKMDFKEFAEFQDKYEQQKKEKAELDEFRKWKKNKVEDVLPLPPKYGMPGDIPSPPTPPPSMIAKTQEKLKPGQCKNKNHIELKICATEVMKYLNQLQFTYFGAIGALFLTLLLSAFNQVLGMGVVLVGVVVSAFFLRNVKVKMLELKQKYGI